MKFHGLLCDFLSPAKMKNISNLFISFHTYSKLVNNKIATSSCLWKIYYVLWSNKMPMQNKFKSALQFTVLFHIQKITMFTFRSKEKKRRATSFSFTVYGINSVIVTVLCDFHVCMSDGLVFHIVCETETMIEKNLLTSRTEWWINIFWFNVFNAAKMPFLVFQNLNNSSLNFNIKINAMIHGSDKTKKTRLQKKLHLHTIF